MDKKILRQVVVDHNKKKLSSNVVPRELLSRVSEFVKTPFVIIISGIRRCGKSTLLDEVRSKQQESYYLNFDDERLASFSLEDFQAMYDLFREILGERDIFFFDEIQNVPEWERFVRRLHDEGKHVFITGSNASMLSKELGTRLTGRNVVFSLYPFSFREFLLWKKCFFTNINTLTSEKKGEIKKFFSEYLSTGGFPEFLKTTKDEYLMSLYEGVLYRDIITRYKIPNGKIVQEVISFAISNIGKELSFNSIKKAVGLTSATTIKEYFSYFENSYLTFLIPRFDVSLKKQIYYNKKVYIIDSALARIIGFRQDDDAGRMLENCVFLELKRKGKEIYFHKDIKECDFIIRKARTILQAIQVTMQWKGNEERERNGLLEAMEKYHLQEGFVLTFDEEERIIHNGKKIYVLPVWKWLLQQIE